MQACRKDTSCAYLAAAQQVAQNCVVVIKQLLADGAQEMVMTDKVWNTFVAQAVHGAGFGGAQISNNSDGIAKQGDRLLNRGAQFLFVL